MTTEQIIIPAGTWCVVVGLPVQFTCDVPVEGEPEELALLHSMLYPPTVHSLVRPSEGEYPMRSCEFEGRGCPACTAASRACLYGIWIWIRSAFQVRKKCER